MEMRAVDVLTNIKNWPAYDYKAYKLDEHESKPCINALENYIWHNVEREGWPKEGGAYLFKTKHVDGLFPDYILKHVSLSNFDYFKNAADEYEIIITHWRKIVDEEDAYYE